MLLADTVDLLNPEELAAVGAQHLEVGRLAVLLVRMPPDVLERLFRLLAARPDVFRQVRGHLLEQDPGEVRLVPPVDHPQVRRYVPAELYALQHLLGRGRDVLVLWPLVAAVEVALREVDDPGRAAPAPR